MSSLRFQILAMIFVFAAPYCSGQNETGKVFKTIEGEVVIAAENFSSKGGTIGNWDIDSTQAGCLDGYYMQASYHKPADGSHLKFKKCLGNLNYIIQFNEPGTYYVHLRTFAAGHTSNGFFATINGKEINYGGTNPSDPSKKAYYIYVAKESKWFWFTAGGGAKIWNLNVSFEIPSAGKYIFTLYRRDLGSKIDHIWLTQHKSSLQRTSTLNLPDHKNFIIADTPGESEKDRNALWEKDEAKEFYPNEDGIISIEAENAMTAKGWVEVEGISGSAMRDEGIRAEGYVEYPVVFDNPGRYYIYGLMRRTDTVVNHRANDAFVTLSGEKPFASDEVTRPDGIRCSKLTFTWESNPKGPGPHTPRNIWLDPIYVEVPAAGKYTFQIGSRSKGFEIDKIILTPNKETPVDLGPPETVRTIKD